MEHLFRIINMLRDRGCGIIYISHKMEEILRISDEVTVMRDGAWVATEPAAEMTMERIIKLMVGRELTNRFPPKDNEIGGVLLEVEGLTAMYSKLRDVSFNVHKGEIVGLAGLDGSGRTEVLENIFGVATRKSGVIRLHGKEVKNRRARDAIKNKFALLTEERRATGIFGILDIQENTTISSLKKYKVKGLYLSRKKMEESTEWSIRAMRIKTPSQDTKIRSLSGGNQQKVILGRWLLTDPEVLLLDEPTRGIDVGAKYEIYQLIINLAKAGQGRYHGVLGNAGASGRVRPHPCNVRRAARRRSGCKGHDAGRDHDACRQIRIRRNHCGNECQTDHQATLGKLQSHGKGG